MSSPPSRAASIAWPLPAPAWRADLAVVLLGLTGLMLWDSSSADLALTRLWGAASGFAWREHWLTRMVLHEGGRLLAFSVLAALILNLWRPWTRRLSRGERWRWLIGTLACALLIPAIKQVSATSCPWDLQEFGGLAQHISHWRWAEPDGGAGHCFPSGHAVSAFAFFGGYFMLREQHAGAARWWLAAVLVLGVAFGWAQMARGAHYPSHTMWSAWLCWTLWVPLAPRRELNHRVSVSA